MLTKSSYFPFLGYSPIPLLCSLSSFNFFCFLGFFLISGDFTLFIFSFLGIGMSFFFWYINFSMEINYIGKLNDLFFFCVKLSFLLFICSEVLFFFSFFWSYFHFYLSPSFEGGGSWPFSFFLFFDWFSLPLVNTLILLSSGLSVTCCHIYYELSDLRVFSFYYLLTILLGLSFVLFQYSEYSNSFFSISDGTFGSCFFMLTGFHGVHVILGCVIMLYVFFFGFVSFNSKNSFISFEFSAWYWHFVDLVWMFLYFFLYYIN